MKPPVNLSQDIHYLGFHTRHNTKWCNHRFSCFASTLHRNSLWLVWLFSFSAEDYTVGCAFPLVGLCGHVDGYKLVTSLLCDFHFLAIGMCAVLWTGIGCAISTQWRQEWSISLHQLRLGSRGCLGVLCCGRNLRGTHEPSCHVSYVSSQKTALEEISGLHCWPDAGQFPCISDCLLCLLW